MTLDGKPGTTTDALQETGRPSGGNGSNPSNSPKTYTQAEVDKLISERHSELDRKLAAANKDVETYKSQLANNQALISGTEERIARLESELEEMAGDDPDRKKVIAKVKILEATERQLKADRANLDAEKLSNAERIKKAEKFERDSIVKDVAAEYQITDNRLATLCEKLNLITKEQITAAAETIGTKQVGAKSETVVPDSGTNSGGTSIFTRESINKMSVEEFAKNRGKILEAQQKGLIK